MALFPVRVEQQAACLDTSCRAKQSGSFARNYNGDKDAPCGKCLAKSTAVRKKPADASLVRES